MNVLSEGANAHVAAVVRVSDDSFYSGV